ncbi:MAG: hypothetical protein SH850_02870 [Planctomycetaceae bacterium]|nr:hypothetical protein [Planctomycetaceae bacterium]
MQSSEWSPAEQDLLRTIALRVRLVTATQIVRGWFADATNRERSPEDVIARLVTAGLMEHRRTEAHPLLDLRQPLFAWKAGTPEPSDNQLRAIAERSRARWDQPHQSVEVSLATKRATALFGAFVDARGSRPHEATHDLHLTEVYLVYRRRFPRLATQWHGEAEFPKMGFEIAHMKDPDAFLIDRTGAATRIIEFAGSYEADHLKAFHIHCAGGAARRLATSGWTKTGSPWARLYSPVGTSYELW